MWKQVPREVPHKKLTCRASRLHLRHRQPDNRKNREEGEVLDGKARNQELSAKSVALVRAFSAAASYELGEYLVALFMA